MLGVSGGVWWVVPFSKIDKELARGVWVLPVVLCYCLSMPMTLPLILTSVASMCIGSYLLFSDMSRTELSMGMYFFMVASSPIIAITMSLFSAVVCLLMMAMSPFSMPALIMLSPVTRRANVLSGSMMKFLGSMMVVSYCSVAVVGMPAATSPINGIGLSAWASMYRFVSLSIMSICVCSSVSCMYSYVLWLR